MKNQNKIKSKSKEIGWIDRNYWNLKFVDSVHFAKAISWCCPESRITITFVFWSCSHCQSEWVRERKTKQKKKERELLPPCFMSILSVLFLFAFFVCDHEHWSSRFEIVVIMILPVTDWFTWNFWKLSFESLPLIILFVRNCVCMYCVCRYLNFECKICRKELKGGGQSTCGHFGFQGLIFSEFLWLRMWSIFLFFVFLLVDDDRETIDLHFETSTLCLFIWLSSFKLKVERVFVDWWWNTLFLYVLKQCLLAVDNVINSGRSWNKERMRMILRMSREYIMRVIECEYMMRLNAPHDCTEIKWCGTVIGLLQYMFECDCLSTCLVSFFLN